MEDPTRTCVIVDGGLASLVNCFIARERILAVGGDLASTPPLAFLPTLDGPTASVRTRAAEKHADILGMKLVRSGARIDSSSGESGLLVAAAYHAARENCDLVDWPIQRAMGDSVDVEAAARDSDRCLLITRLVSMDTLRPQFKVDCPLVDLTDRQLCDMAVDMDLPVSMCWWWNESFVQRILTGQESEIPAVIAKDQIQSAQYRECLRMVPVLKEVRFIGGNV